MKFFLMTNGLEDHGGAFEELLKFMDRRQKNFDYLAIKHPILKNQPSRTFVFENGKEKIYKRKFNYPPLTYIFDFFYTPKFKEQRTCITFNPLSTIFTWIRNRKRIDYLVLWSIDFVPKKFNNFILNKIYKSIDTFAHKLVDEHWEVSESALSARSKYLKKNTTLHKVVPIGISESAFDHYGVSRFSRREVVYFGSIDHRNGIDKLIEAIKILSKIDNSIKFKIIGSGPLLDVLKLELKNEVLQGVVNILGFIKDESKVFQLLGEATVAIAPYSPDANNFAYYADPGKLKAYLAAGLPIVTNFVPPNAQEISELTGVKILSNDSNASDYANQILAIMEDADHWAEISKKSSEYAKNFIWENIFKQHLLRN